MPRAPKPPIVSQAPVINEELVRQDIIETAQVIDNVQAMALQLGYEGSLAIGALEDEIRFYQRRSVEAALALGTRLLLLKEMTAHGEFTERTQLLGINERMARRFMSATLKFAKTDSKSVLLAAGNQTKLLELIVLDDEEIAELASGGSARGIDLDEIATMTVTELRAALRKAKEADEIKDRQLQAKDSKINELDAQLSNPKKRAPEPWDAAEHLQAMESAVLTIQGTIKGDLRIAVEELMHERSAAELPRDERQAIAAALGRIKLAVTEVGALFGLTPNESDDLGQQSKDELDGIWAKTMADVAAKGVANHAGETH